MVDLDSSPTKLIEVVAVPADSNALATAPEKTAF